MKIATAAFVLAGLIAGPAFAQTAAAPESPRDRMKSCNAEAKSQGIKGADRKTFMSGCLKGDASAAAAAPAPQAARPVPTTATPAQPVPTAPASAPTAGAKAARQPSAGQLAERERIKQCGAEWKSDKAAGKVAADATWPKYWSACNTRLKGG